MWYVIRSHHHTSAGIIAETKVILAASVHICGTSALVLQIHVGRSWAQACWKYASQ
jgi:hypothetical protein